MRYAYCNGERREMNEKQRKPKFQIGEEVKIELLNSVGKITNIIHLPSHFIYEINKNDGLFFEESLQSICSKVKTDKEKVELTFCYDFDDFAKVNGYGEDIYRIVGKRLEVWRYKSDTWEDIIYELTKITDGEWLEANEADIICIDWNEEELAFLMKKKSSWKNKWSRLDAEKLKAIQGHKKIGMHVDRNQIIDELLDLHNDYTFMFQKFRDEQYQTVVELIEEKLSKLVEKA